MHVHDVGPGRSGDQQISQSFEKWIRIVLRQGVRRAEALACRSFERAAIRNRAGSIRRTIRAIRSSAENDGIVEARDLHSRRQRKFLIAPTASGAM